MALKQNLSESVRRVDDRVSQKRVSQKRSSHRRAVVILAVLSISLTTVASGPAEAAKKAMRPEKFEAAYREILSTLARGQEEQALEDLYELETAVMQGRPTPGRIDHFWRLKLGVVRELIQSESVELLVPVIVLHHEAYVMYREKDQRALAAHSRQMAAELAEYYGNKSEQQDARLFSAWILTSFGAYLQDYWALASSADLFERALARDPRNVVALVRLAAALEKNGEYEEAVARLEKAALLRPDDSHIAVRLALCQVRMDDRLTGDSIQRLEGVVDSEPTPWILSVAYQELARLQVAAGRSDEAERQLRRGLERLPGDQYIAVELSLILDRRRSPKEAAQVLNGIDAGDWEGKSPRYLYNTWPDEGIDETRSQIKSSMRDHLRPLEAGLTSAPTEGVGR